VGPRSGFSVLIAVVLIVFIYQPVKVEGTSMTPTLQNDERIFINKFTYRFGLASIARGDTVWFWYPQDESKSYIKRVIGVPGPDSRGWRPGLRERPTTRRGVRPPSIATVSHGKTVNPKSYQRTVFRAGDHRNSSSDSRTWDTSPQDIYGRRYLCLASREDGPPQIAHLRRSTSQARAGR